MCTKESSGGGWINEVSKGRGKAPGIGKGECEREATAGRGRGERELKNGVESLWVLFSTAVGTCNREDEVPNP